MCCMMSVDLLETDHHHNTEFIPQSAIEIMSLVESTLSPTDIPARDINHETQDVMTLPPGKAL